MRISVPRILAARKAEEEVKKEKRWIGWRNDLHPSMSIMFRGKEYGITRIDDFEGYKQDLVIYAYVIK